MRIDNQLESCLISRCYLYESWSCKQIFRELRLARKFNFQMSRLMARSTLVLLKKLMNSDHLMIFACTPGICVSSEASYIGQFMMICLTSSLGFNFLRFGHLSSSTNGVRFLSAWCESEEFYQLSTSDFNIVTSRVSGRGHRTGAVFSCVCLSVCASMNTLTAEPFDL